MYVFILPNVLADNAALKGDFFSYDSDDRRPSLQTKKKGNTNLSCPQSFETLGVQPSPAGH